MINITDAAKEDAITPIWRQAFRPFFLGGALFSLLAILLWSLFLSGKLTFTPFGNPVFWHSHEMLFGFVCAIIVGFLLTAVQNWTGLRATNGVPLMMIFLLWLAARILMATNLVPNPMFVAAVDVAFLPVCALLMARLVIKAGNKRNLFFVPVLLLLAAFNGLSHAGVVLGNAEWVNWAHRSVVFLIVAIITVVAGRVIPMFSANGTGTQRVEPTPRLDRALLASTWIIALLFVTNQYDKLPVMLVTALFVVSAILHLVRAVHWRPSVTFGVPLVWSLHLAYWFIPMGFVLFSAHFAYGQLGFSTALHALTAGAMGSMILAMIARVSLGHSGRPLAIPTYINLAFMLLILAALVRVASGIWPQLLLHGAHLISGVLWTGAFGLYLMHYVKILITPRADGRPG